MVYQHVTNGIAEVTYEIGQFSKKPIYTLAFLRFHLIIVTLYLSSISYGVMIMVAVSTQQCFSLPPYSFDSVVIGLLFLPRSIGVILGSLACGMWSDYIMHREAEKQNHFNENRAIVHVPEDRMRENAWISLAIVPSAVLWFGWTVEYNLLWIILVGFSICTSNILYVDMPTPRL